MDRIVVDDSFKNQLPDPFYPCVVFDSAGNQIGYFTPAVDPELYRGLEPSVSDEELSRRERAGGGRPLSEILADLDKSE